MPIKYLLPRPVRITSSAKLLPRHWNEEGSIYLRLPEFYRKAYLDYRKTMPKPVHYKPSEKTIEFDHTTGEVKRVQDVPPVVIFPREARQGIWGGEGVVFGYKRPKRSGFTRPVTLVAKTWRPRVLKVLFYSEIMDKHYALTCTRSALDQIEEAKGFDNYILKTHIVDLQSDFATQLKREMLIKLAKKDTDLYPNDVKKREVIYNRYKTYEMPLKEAEWFGLHPWEAVQKQKQIEAARNKELKKPWKETFARELAQYLEQLKLEGKEVPPTEKRPEEAPLSLRKSIWKEWTKKLE